jgi:5'-nucleotidase
MARDTRDGHVLRRPGRFRRAASASGLPVSSWAVAPWAVAPWAVVLSLATGVALVGAACGKDKLCATDGGVDGVAAAGGGSAGGKGGAGGAAGAGGAGGAPVAHELVILHTNDLHSHLMGDGPEADYTPLTINDDATLGGMARLMTAIAKARADAAAAGKPVLLLDAGDFMMGSLFHFLATTNAAELAMMQAAKYDATTIGNHELDWTPTGLAGILAAATKGGPTVPIVASNMHFSDTDPRDDALAAFSAAGVIQRKLILTVGGLKVGIFGLLGKDAVQVTPQAAPLTFDPIATAAAAMVAELRQTDQVDLVIALSHSGIYSTGLGEDADLAAAVSGIDVIVSGHTHDSLPQPVVVKNTHTVIVTAGAYGHFLGDLDLSVTPSATPGGAATVVVNGYTLGAIDDSIPGDAATQTAVNAYIAGIDTALAPNGLTYRGVVASTASDLTLPQYQEAPIGDLVVDAYRTIAGALIPAGEPPIVAAFEGNGQLRSILAKGKTGKIWLSDLYRVTPLGIGPNNLPGSPLVSFYLNAKDIASGLELGGAKAGDGIDDQYTLQISGLKVTYDMSKPLFGRVAGVSLVDGAGVETVLDKNNTTTCYRVVATNFVAGLLGVVKTFTQGLLSVVAKDVDCATPVDPTTRFVDADPTTVGVQELKQWQAVLKFVSNFPDTNNDQIPDVPTSYATALGRIIKN